ncbi:GNAT family N-acetyltransferase [Ectopseudomonas mendocina]|uniref:GNAT family N-acetyltransferase n=1 Tax=Ectopseudomonas mendocina TaxID=300 RepID=A0ABZ2RKT7_ECTME
MHLETSRLILRLWRKSDLDGFAELNADSQVMRHFPACLTRQQSDALAERCQGYIESQGWGFWAIEEKASGQFVGFTGLHHQPEKFSFSPCTEIGWRLHRRFWGRGYATEAAIVCLDYAFDDLGLLEVVAFTAHSNHRSEAVMRRLGMSFKQTFLHPDVDPESSLSTHLLYGIEQGQYRRAV